MCGDGRAVSFAKSSLAPDGLRPGPIRSASAHGAIDECVHCLAHVRESALRDVLSLALFSAVGVRVLMTALLQSHPGI